MAWQLWNCTLNYSLRNNQTVLTFANQPGSAHEGESDRTIFPYVSEAVVKLTSAAGVSSKVVSVGGAHVPASFAHCQTAECSKSHWINRLIPLKSQFTQLIAWKSAYILRFISTRPYSTGGHTWWNQKLKKCSPINIYFDTSIPNMTFILTSDHFMVAGIVFEAPTTVPFFERVGETRPPRLPCSLHSSPLALRSFLLPAQNSSEFTEFEQYKANKEEIR